jgi:hypothetical protein
MIQRIMIALEPSSFDPYSFSLSSSSFMNLHIERTGSQRKMNFDSLIKQLRKDWENTQRDKLRTNSRTLFINQNAKRLSDALRHST